jgi:D-erythro-7,8-dihydroneopterin triphosphate epimerase
MHVSDARIGITDLRLRTFVGFNDEELEKKQDVVIRIEIFYDAVSACQSDQKVDALDYKVITKSVIALVENGRFKLLEKLSHEVLQEVMRYPQVKRATVSVEKPHALRFADSVSATLSASRTEEK